MSFRVPRFTIPPTVQKERIASLRKLWGRGFLSTLPTIPLSRLAKCTQFFVNRVWIGGNVQKALPDEREHDHVGRR